MAINRVSPQAEKSTATIEYTNVAEGEHEGRLVYVADLGLQERNFAGEEKPPAQQLSLGIELVGQEQTLSDGGTLPRILWSKPFNIFQTMNERGNEYKYYKMFVPTARDGEVADWDKVLGMPINVVVTHTKSGDRTYDNISSMSAIPSKYQDQVAKAATAEMSVGDAEDENNVATKAMFGLVKYLHDKRVNGPVVEKSTPVTAKAVADQEFADDIPF
jgi:hypothetical protein|tara:strand:+ start:445 stop:1095 length:651 start_codon:yes stop_codon:yes gene_type:complete